MRFRAVLVVGLCLGMPGTPLAAQVAVPPPAAMPLPQEEMNPLPAYAMIRQPVGKLPGRSVISALTFVDAAGTTLATGTSGGEITLWNLTQRLPIRVLHGHESGVKGLAVSATGETLASAGWDDTVRLWEVATGTCRLVLQGHQRGVSAVAFQPRGRLLASGSADQTVRLWDTQTGQLCHVLQGHQGPVTGVSFTPDGRTLATASTDGTLRLWDVAQAKPLGQLVRYQEATEWVHDVAFAPDGETLAAGYADGRLVLWEWRMQRELRSWQAHQGAVFSLTFSQDGKSLATGGVDSLVRLWETATGLERLRYLGHDQKVRNVILAARGMGLASGGDDGQLLLWSRQPETAPAAGRDLEQAWQELAHPQAAPAYRVICALAAQPTTLELLRSRLQPAPPTGVTRSLPELITALDSPRFADREQAVRDLVRLGPTARDALRKELGRSPLSVEVRRRIEWLLLHLENSQVPPDELRTLRAVEVLERLATPEARAILQRLAAGAPGAALTTDARATLARLGSANTNTP